MDNSPQRIGLMSSSGPSSPLRFQMDENDIVQHNETIVDSALLPPVQSEMDGNEIVQHIESMGHEIVQHIGSMSDPSQSSQLEIQIDGSEIVQHTESTSNEPPEMDVNDIYQMIDTIGNSLFHHMQTTSSTSVPLPPLRLQVDGKEVVLNIGSTSNSKPSSPAGRQTQRDNNLSMNTSNANVPDWKRTLFKAVLRGDWEEVKQIVDTQPEATRIPVSLQGKTLLMVAISEGRDMSSIQELIDMMPAEELALTDSSGQTALHEAVLVGNISIAKLLIAKNPELPNLRRTNNFLPIHLAALGDQREMTFYLYSVTRIDDPASTDLIQCAVGAGMFDLALHLLQQNPMLSWKRNSPLGDLAEEPSSFPSGTQLNIFQSLLYLCIPMKYSTKLIQNIVQEQIARSANHTRLPTTQFSIVYQELRRVLGKFLDKLVRPIQDIRQAKLKHCLVLELLRRVCMEFKKLDEISVSVVLSRPFILAIQNGIHEIVEEILKEFPNAITYTDEENHTALKVAAAYRHEKIFNILHKKRGSSQLVLNSFDDDKNSILHLVAYKPKQNQLDTRSGAVLQMQRELQWFKGVQKLVMPVLRNVTNNEGKTPLMIFDEEHREMVANESQWIIGMANSCIVGASLIATVVFAAAITVPGGNNSDGLPMFSKDVAFKVFAFSDALALVSSITTVLIFLSIFTARYSVNDHIYALPNRLIIGIISLFLSVTFMMIAFVAIVNLVVAKDDWVIIPTAALACVPVIFFAYLQLPSLLKLIKSTYGPSIFKSIQH